MKKTRIEWADSTWNPVTGCYHDCPYCYAGRTARRFSGCDNPPNGADGLRVIDLKGRLTVTDGKGKARNAMYPFGFRPTFHEYRLGDLLKKGFGETVFVCSMADLFGEWVPDKWIEEVFNACKEAEGHRYLFLTKNPDRYMELAKAGKLPEEKNFWYGSTATTPDTKFWWSKYHNTFVSIEPMLKPFQSNDAATVKKVGWIIMGAMTGPGSSNHQPKSAWVESMVKAAAAAGVPVFMKDSLVPIMGEEKMVREFPW